MTYGYVRVSSKDQNEIRQFDDLIRHGVEKANIIMDKQSGKDFCRKGYTALRRRLREGDLLIIKSIDRLGRNYEEILEQWRIITKGKRADIRILDMPLLDTTAHKDLTGTLISDIVLQLLSYVAQSEREYIRLRQREGILAAKRRGVQFGRPPLKLPNDFAKVYQEWKLETKTAKECAAALQMNIRTFYRKAKEYESQN